MSRPTLLYASPLPPEKSGISTYSEALLQGLCGRFDITLLSRQRRPRLRGAAATLPVLRHGVDTVDPAGFDGVLYNFGNHPEFHSFIYDTFVEHPGPVVLHDVVLYFLTVGRHENRGDVFGKVYELAGPEGVRLLREERRRDRHLLHYAEPERLPLNDEIVQRAPLLLVHSQFARRTLLSRFPDASVRVLPMVDPVSALATLPADPGTADALLGLTPDTPLIASFGIIAPTKQNRRVCRALARLPEIGGRAPVYVMVGEGDHADGFLGPRVHKTGFVDDATYDAVLERCDLVVNLRHPTMGETSISQIQAMSRGKTCVVTDEAWFAELPADAVLRVPAEVSDDDLAGVLAGALRDHEQRAARGRRARAYIHEHHDAGHVADLLDDLLGDHVSRR